jgi:hypothetical protein
MINKNKIPFRKKDEMQISSFRAKKRTMDTLKNNRVNISKLVEEYLDEVAKKFSKSANPDNNG